MSRLKSFKRLLSVLVILSLFAGLLTVGTSNIAYAADDTKESAVSPKTLVSDIEDRDVKDAVLRLNAFGVVSGRTDGKYHPDDKVTREEFARILVSALKMDDAAKAAKGTSKFKDVEATRWSAGYIEVAAGHGLIYGRPGGYFAPTDEVSYAEAIAMLVRALGYKDEFLVGTWPGKYLAKGSEKELTKKVKFSDPAGNANRGEVAVLVNNTLDAKVVKVDTYEGSTTKYYESEKTLLEDKLNIEKVEDTRIIANKRMNDGLEKDEVTVREYDKKSKKFSEKDYDFLADRVNPELFLGEESTIYLNDDDEVIYIEREYDDKAYFDYIKEVASDKNKNVSQFTLQKADDDFEFAEDAVIYTLKDNKYKMAKLDEDNSAVKDLNSNAFLGKVGKFVIKNRQIVYAEVMDTSEADPWMIVTSNKNGELEGINEDDKEFTLNLSEDGIYDGVMVFDKDGDTIKVSDIEKGNLIYVQKQSYDGDDYAVVRVVKDNVAKGKFDRLKNDKIIVAGKEYNVIKYTKDGKDVFQTFYSIDDGDTIKTFELENGKAKQELIDDMDDADEEEVAVYLDVAGRVAYFVTEAEASSGYKFGIVTRKYADNDRIKVYTIDNKGEGDEIIYKVEEEDNVTSTARLLNQYGQKLKDDKYSGNNNKTGLKIGSVIKFKLNKDGEIAEDKLYVMDPANLWRINASDDFGKDYLPKAGLIDSSHILTGGVYNHGEAGFDVTNIKEVRSFSVKDNIALIDAENYRFKSASATPNDVAIINYNSNKLYADINGADDFSETKWKNLAEANGVDNFMYVFCDDDKEINAEAAIFIGKASGSAGNDEVAIYVKDMWYKGGDTVIEYMEYGEDKLESRVLDNGTDYFNNNNDEHPYIAKVKANGKVDIVKNPVAKKPTADGYMIVSGKVTARKSDSITLKGIKDHIHNAAITTGNDTRMYSISNKTLVWDEDTKKSASNIVVGDTVIIVIENDSARVIGITDGDEVTPAPSTPTTSCTVNYKAATPNSLNEGRIIIGTSLYTVNASTLLFSVNKEVEAVGYEQIEGKLTTGVTQVIEIKEVNGTIVSFRLKANFAALEGKIREVEALDKATYTSESWTKAWTETKLADQLAEAKKVAANESAKQTEIDEATALLNAQLQLAKGKLIAKDSSSTLSELTVDGNKVPGFAANKLKYEVTVPYGTTKVPTVAGTATNAGKAAVTVNQASSLTETTSARTAEVTVTAENGTKTVYEVTFDVAAISVSSAVYNPDAVAVNTDATISIAVVDTANNSIKGLKAGDFDITVKSGAADKATVTIGAVAEKAGALGTYEFKAKNSAPDETVYFSIKVKGVTLVSDGKLITNP